MMQTKCAQMIDRKVRRMAEVVTQICTRLHTCVNEFYKHLTAETSMTTVLTSPFPSIRFPLEHVIHVRLTPAQKCDQTGQEVRRYEQWPPALGLPHMDPLVRPRQREQFQVAPKHDVTEGHRRGAAFEKRTMSKKPGNDPAMDFQHAVHDFCTTSAQKRQRPKPQSGGRRRKRPNVKQAGDNRRSARHDRSSVAARLSTPRTRSTRYAQSALNTRLGRSVDKLDRLGWWRFAEQSRPEQAAGPIRKSLSPTCPAAGVMPRECQQLVHTRGPIKMNVTNWYNRKLRAIDESYPQSAHPPYYCCYLDISYM